MAGDTVGKFILLSLADSRAVGSIAAECSLVELRGGWGLRSSELLLKEQMQEKRKYVLFTELVQCKAGKEHKDRLE